MWVQHATGRRMMWNKLMRRNYGGQPEGKKTFGRPSCRWEDKINIQMCTDVFNHTQCNILWICIMWQADSTSSVGHFQGIAYGNKLPRDRMISPCTYMYLWSCTTEWRWPTLEVETGCQIKKFAKLWVVCGWKLRNKSEGYTNGGTLCKG